MKTLAWKLKIVKPSRLACELFGGMGYAAVAKTYQRVAMQIGKDGALLAAIEVLKKKLPIVKGCPFSLHIGLKLQVRCLRMQDLWENPPDKLYKKSDTAQ